MVENENIDLQRKVETLRVEEEARRKLEERTETLKSQISENQVLLDKENAKYKSVCRQLEVSVLKRKCRNNLQYVYFILCFTMI